MKKTTMKILATAMCIITIICMSQLFAAAVGVEDRIEVEEDEVLIIDIAEDEFGFVTEEEPVQETVVENNQPENARNTRTITLAEIFRVIFGFLFAM